MATFTIPATCCCTDTTCCSVCSPEALPATLYATFGGVWGPQGPTSGVPYALTFDAGTCHWVYTVGTPGAPNSMLISFSCISSVTVRLTQAGWDGTGALTSSAIDDAGPGADLTCQPLIAIFNFGGGLTAVVTE